jgi:2-desacetyl-2-hydroxyethyl bacteriochlorophyllide A dehydrogenase
MAVTKAAVLKAPYNISLEDVQKPEPGVREILVRVRATGICGTDVKMYSGKWKVKLPLIIGHESTGEVAGVGKEVTAFKVGDRVVINPVFSCGECYYCIKGRTNLCLSGGMLGRERSGTYAEYVVVPQRMAFKFPDNISFENATVIELLVTVLHAQKRIRIFPGDSVAVLGQGAAGLLHTRLAKLSGADPVIVISRSQWKLDLAKRFGADKMVNATTDDVCAKIKEYTDGRGADVVIESVGSPETIRQCVTLVRPGGTVLLFGICPEPVDAFNAFPFYLNEIDVVGSRAMTDEDFEPCIRLVASNTVNVEPLITHRFPLGRLKEGLDFMCTSATDALRVAVIS